MDSKTLVIHIKKLNSDLETVEHGWTYKISEDITEIVLHHQLKLKKKHTHLVNSKLQLELLKLTPNQLFQQWKMLSYKDLNQMDIVPKPIQLGQPATKNCVVDQIVKLVTCTKLKSLHQEPWP